MLAAARSDDAPCWASRPARRSPALAPDMNMEHSETDFTNPFRRPPPDRHDESANDAAVRPAPAPFVYHPSDCHYDMSGDKVMVIFNHYQYKKSRFFRKHPTTRTGTEQDVERLTQVFGALGFAVTTHHDQTHDQILDIISKLSVSLHRGTACVCVCVLTHGAARGELLAADRPYELRDLVAPLQRAPALVGRPKLFVVQACRGEELDAGLTELDGGEGGARLGSHADTLVLTSSVEDFVSWRDADGSWLVQALCRVVEGAHRQLDLLQMAALVTSLVTREHESNTPRRRALHGKKQTPETRSTLTKLLRFSPAAPPIDAV